MGALQIVTGNRLEPHFLENEEGYRKSEYTIAKGIKKQSIQYMLGFSKVNTIFLHSRVTILTSQLRKCYKRLEPIIRGL